MIIEVHLLSQSHPVIHDSVINAYTKGPLYCVLAANGDVYKYPVENLFRAVERRLVLSEIGGSK